MKYKMVSIMVEDVAFVSESDLIENLNLVIIAVNQLYLMIILAFEKMEETKRYVMSVGKSTTITKRAMNQHKLNYLNCRKVNYERYN